MIHELDDCDDGTGTLVESGSTIKFGSPQSAIDVVISGWSGKTTTQNCTFNFTWTSGDINGAFTVPLTAADTWSLDTGISINWNDGTGPLTSNALIEIQKFEGSIPCVYTCRVYVVNPATFRSADLFWGGSLGTQVPLVAGDVIEWTNEDTTDANGNCRSGASVALMGYNGTATGDRAAC